MKAILAVLLSLCLQQHVVVSQNEIHLDLSNHTNETNETIANFDGLMNLTGTSLNFTEPNGIRHEETIVNGTEAILNQTESQSNETSLNATIPNVNIIQTISTTTPTTNNPPINTGSSTTNESANNHEFSHTIMPSILQPTYPTTKNPSISPISNGNVTTTPVDIDNQESLESATGLYGCDDSCCLKFQNSSRCTFEAVSNVTDTFTLSQESNANYRSDIDRCFSSNGCQKPDYNADIMAEIHINWRPKIQIFKSWWDNMEDSQRQCVVKYFVANDTNCPTPSYRVDTAKKAPFLEPRVHSQRRSVLQTRINILRYAEKCVSNATIIQCVRDKAIGFIKPHLCIGKQTCEGANGLNGDQTCLDRIKTQQKCLPKGDVLPSPNYDAIDNVLTGGELKATLLLQCNAKVPKLESRAIQGGDIPTPANVLSRLFQVILARDLLKFNTDLLCQQ